MLAKDDTSIEGGVLCAVGLLQHQQESQSLTLDQAVEHNTVHEQTLLQVQRCGAKQTNRKRERFSVPALIIIVQVWALRSRVPQKTQSTKLYGSQQRTGTAVR
jgi:hypothetical protein